MTAIGLWYDYQQSITTPTGPFGITILSWGIILFVIGSVGTILQLRHKISKLENPKSEIEIYPNSPAGRTIELVVYNKGKTPANFNATMTCTFDYGGLMTDVGIEGLKNVSMCWVTSGKSTETISGGGWKILKLCSFGDRADKSGSLLRYMQFCKVESDSLQTVEGAHYSQDSSIPKAKVDIKVASTLPIKGRSIWAYEVGYVEHTNYLKIFPQRQSSRKSLIGKVLRVKKFE